MSRLDELLKEKARRESQTEISPEPSPTPAPTPTQTTTTSRLDGLLAEKQRRQQPTSSRLDQLLMEKQRRDSSLPVIQEQHKVISNLDRGTIKSLLHTGDQYQTALKKQYPNLDVSQRNGQVIVKQAGDKEWRVLDPSGWQGLGELGKDVTDWSYDIATAVPRLGSWAGGILGGAAAEGLTEAGRQGLAKGLGLKDDISAGTIGAATAFGAAGPLVGKGISKGVDAARRGLFNRGKAVVSRFDIDNASLKLAGQRMSKNVPGLKDVDEATREALGGWVQQNKLVDATSISDKALLPNLQKKSKLVDQEYKEFWNQVNAQNPGPLMKEFSAKIDNILQDPKMAPQYKELTKSLKTSYAEITGSSKALNSIYNLSPDMKVNLIGRSIRDILKSKSIKGKPKADLLDLLGDGIMELDSDLHKKVAPELWSAFDSLYTDRVMIDLLYDSTNNKLREHGGSAVKQFMSSLGRNMMNRGLGALLLGGGAYSAGADVKTVVGVGGSILLAPYASRFAKNLVIKHGFKTPTKKFGSSIKEQLLKFPRLKLTGTPSAGLSIKKISDVELDRLVKQGKLNSPAAQLTDDQILRAGIDPSKGRMKVGRSTLGLPDMPTSHNPRNFPEYDPKSGSTEFRVGYPKQTAVEEFGPIVGKGQQRGRVPTQPADDIPPWIDPDSLDDDLRQTISERYRAGELELGDYLPSKDRIELRREFRKWKTAQKKKKKVKSTTDIREFIRGKRYAKTMPEVPTPKNSGPPSPLALGKDKQIILRTHLDQETAKQAKAESLKNARKSFTDPNTYNSNVRIGLDPRTAKEIRLDYRDAVQDPIYAYMIPEADFKRILKDPRLGRRKKEVFQQIRLFSVARDNEFRRVMGGDKTHSPNAQALAKLNAMKYGLMKVWERIRKHKTGRPHFISIIERDIQKWEAYMVSLKQGKNPVRPDFELPGDLRRIEAINYQKHFRGEFNRAGTSRTTKIKTITDAQEAAAQSGQRYTPPEHLGVNTSQYGANEGYLRETYGKKLGRPFGAKTKPKPQLTIKDLIEQLKKGK